MSETATQTVNTEGAHAIARRMAKTLELKNAIANLTTQRDEANKRADKADKALSDLQAKHEASPLAKQNAQLKQQLRDVEHRKTFDALAKEKGVTNEKAIDTLYEKSGWKAEADEFDADQMGATIDTTLEEHAYLKTATQNGQQENGSQVKPAPGKGQGHSGKKASSDPAIIEDDDPRMSNSAWQMANWDKMSASAAAKRARGDFDPSKFKTVQMEENGTGVDHLSTH
jgi:hypothetical protein